LEDTAAALAKLDASPSHAGVRAELTANVERLKARLQAPEFSFGGMIDQLVVTVVRSPETKGHYDTDIDIKFRAAGIVPEPFPLSVLADSLVVKVREDSLQFEGKGFKGLRGGVATVSGALDLTDPERTAKVPRMHIDARGLAVDDLLIRAIPESMGHHGDNE